MALNFGISLLYNITMTIIETNRLWWILCTLYCLPCQHIYESKNSFRSTGNSRARMRSLISRSTGNSRGVDYWRRLYRFMSELPSVGSILVYLRLIKRYAYGIPYKCPHLYNVWIIKFPLLLYIWGYLLETYIVPLSSFSSRFISTIYRYSCHWGYSFGPREGKSRVRVSR